MSSVQPITKSELAQVMAYGVNGRILDLRRYTRPSPYGLRPVDERDLATTMFGLVKAIERRCCQPVIRFLSTAFDQALPK